MGQGFPAEGFTADDFQQNNSLLEKKLKELIENKVPEDRELFSKALDDPRIDHIKLTKISIGDIISVNFQKYEVKNIDGKELKLKEV